MFCKLVKFIFEIKNVYPVITTKEYNEYMDCVRVLDSRYTKPIFSMDSHSVIQDGFLAASR